MKDIKVDGYERLPKNDYWAVKYHLVKYGITINSRSSGYFRGC